MLAMRSAIGALAITLGTLTSSAIAQSALPETQFKVIGPMVETLTWKVSMQPFFGEELPQLSQGRIQPDLVSMTSLGLKGSEVFRMIKIGVAELGATGTSYVAGEIPEFDGLDLAGLIQDVETLDKVVEAYTPVLNEVMTKRAGVRMLAVWPSVAQVVWCAKPVDGLAGLKGLKVRVLGTTQSDFIKAIGAEPITMSPAEVVTAMQRGVIDCAITGSESGYRAKWPEVATHLYPINLGWSLWTVVANEKAWAAMPQESRDFMMQKFREVMITRAWRVAKEGSDEGVWCSVGDDRCTLAKTLNSPTYNLTLVPHSEADDAARKEAVANVVVPAFAKRCGAECTEKWNETVGKVLGITAKP